MQQAKRDAYRMLISARTQAKGEAAGKAKAAFRYLTDRLPLGFGFFLLSLAECLGVPSPYAICVLAALPGDGTRSGRPARTYRWIFRPGRK